MKITEEGKIELEKKLEQMKNKLKDLEVEKALAYTATGDTWHDNPYFDLLRRDEETLVKEIKTFEEFLYTAEITETNRVNTDSVEIGSIIKCICKYSFDDESEEMIIKIVGHGEGDREGNKIAYDSPVGQNLMGHGQGDIIEFSVPAGMVSYEIVCFLQ